MAASNLGAHTGDNESVLELLEHFKDDDGRVATLITELKELSGRVQAADLAALDPRSIHNRKGSPGGDSGPGSGGRHGRQRHRGAGGFRDAVDRVRDQLHSAPGPAQERRPSITSTAGAAGSLSFRSGAGMGPRIEEAHLPAPPEDTSTPLPLPAGGHEWEALQAAVNDSVAHFGAAAAKMGWKKWALTRAHSALLVSLFWWVVAVVFKSDHPLSRPIQDYAFGHFCRHYVTCVLRLRGKARDQYQQVWIEMMAAAALYLLAEVFPRSQHKFDDGLKAVIIKQLRLWTAGALPADMHPSVHSDAHDASPAAFGVAASAASAAAAAAPATGRSSLAKPVAASPPSASLQLPSFTGPSVVYYGRLQGQMPSEVLAPAGAAAAGGSGSNAPARGVAHGGGPQAFVSNKTSPVMAQMLASGGEVSGLDSAAALGGPPVLKGLMKHTVGGTLARLHRALDEGSDDELSYSRLAASATASATDAVAAYEASKRAAASEMAALRRGLVESRGAIEARQRAAMQQGGTHLKQMSDRLSGYIRNDVDRLLAGQPTSTEPGTTAELPRYMRAGNKDANGNSGVMKPARLMAPLSEMRRVEGNIRSALAGGRHSSTDTAAHIAASTAARQAAAAADWRPLAEFPVGTKDTRRRKMAATILHGLDLGKYS